MFNESTDAVWQRTAADVNRMNQFQIARIVLFKQRNEPSGRNFVCHMKEAYAGNASDDAEIAAVANYVINHFAGQNGKVTPSDVAKAR